MWSATRPAPSRMTRSRASRAARGSRAGVRASPSVGAGELPPGRVGPAGRPDGLGGLLDVFSAHADTPRVRGHPARDTARTPRAVPPSVRDRGAAVRGLRTVGRDGRGGAEGARETPVGPVPAETDRLVRREGWGIRVTSGREITDRDVTQRGRRPDWGLYRGRLAPLGPPAQRSSLPMSSLRVVVVGGGSTGRPLRRTCPATARA